VLAAGKHAICEKPLVSSLQKVDELVQLEREAIGRRIMPIFQYRFGHGLQKLKWLVESGVAGTPYLATVETAWRRRAPYYAVPWRGKWATEMGGALISHAIHAHDMLCYVLGPVRRVFARCVTRVNPIEVEDCATIALEMLDGSLASLGVTLGSSAEVTRHRFSFGNLVAESNTRPYTNSGEPWMFSPDSPEADAAIQEALTRFTALPEGYVGQFHRFYDAVVSGGELPVTLADARAAIELITAMYYSNDTCQMVELPIGPDHPRYTRWHVES
jgi:predicted dehydrogenase